MHALASKRLPFGQLLNPIFSAPRFAPELRTVTSRNITALKNLIWLTQARSRQKQLFVAVIRSPCCLPAVVSLPTGPHFAISSGELLHGILSWAISSLLSGELLRGTPSKRSIWQASPQHTGCPDWSNAGVANITSLANIPSCNFQNHCRFLPKP